MIERIAEMPEGTIGFRFSVWEDIKTGARFGLGNLSAWKRTAVITEVEWIRHMMGLFGWMAPGELKLFGLGELEAAKAWVAG